MSLEDQIGQLAAAVERQGAMLAQVLAVVEHGRRFSSPSDAAAAVGVSVRTMRRWIKSGAVRSTRVGRCVRVDLSSLKAIGADEIAVLADEARAPRLAVAK